MLMHARAVHICSNALYDAHILRRAVKDVLEAHIFSLSKFRASLGGTSSVARHGCVSMCEWVEWVGSSSFLLLSSPFPYSLVYRVLSIVHNSVMTQNMCFYGEISTQDVPTDGTYIYDVSTLENPNGHGEQDDTFSVIEITRVIQFHMGNWFKGSMHSHSLRRISCNLPRSVFHKCSSRPGRKYFR